MARPFLPGPGQLHGGASLCHHRPAATGCDHVTQPVFTVPELVQFHYVDPFSIPDYRGAHAFTGTYDQPPARRLVVSTVLAGPDDAGGLLP